VVGNALRPPAGALHTRSVVPDRAVLARVRHDAGQCVVQRIRVVFLVVCEVEGGRRRERVLEFVLLPFCYFSLPSPVVNRIVAEDAELDFENAWRAVDARS
jgi:hypothetical protein